MPFHIDLDFLIWIVVSFTSGSIIFLIFFLLLYRHNKLSYLKNWILYWFINTILYLVLYLSIHFKSETLVLLYLLLIPLSGFFFYQGTLSYTEKSRSTLLLKVVGSFQLLIILSVIFVEWIGWGWFFSFLSYALFLFQVSMIYFKQNKRAFLYPSIITLLFGFLTFVYPFFVLSSWFIPWGYFIIGSTGLLMGMSTVQLHFMKHHASIEKLNDKLTYYVEHDVLTGVYNRYHLNNQLEMIERNDLINWGIIYIDLNYFKEVNDQFGHQKGDKALNEIGVKLKEVIHDLGIVTRYGGDEFVILVPCATQELIDQMTQSIKELETDLSSFNHRLSFAIGSGIKTKANQSIYQVLDMAEKAMYKDKRENK